MGSTRKVAFLFPGNGVDYEETLKRLKEEEVFKENLKRARHELGYYPMDVIGDGTKLAGSSELANYLTIYTICCSIGDLYKKQGLSPAIVSGYSLGLHSCLYAAEVYSFETGLLILAEFYRVVKRFYEQKKKKFGMGTIIGLTKEEVINLLFNNLKDFLEIACINGERSLVIVGEEKSVTECLLKAEQAGAFKTIQIKTELGYHTSLLKGQMEELRAFIGNCEIREPRCSILSPLDLTLVKKDSVIEEMVRNLYSPIHWQTLMTAIIKEHGILEGYEVGPGESLTKMAKNIDKQFKMYPFSTGVAQ